MSTAPNDKPSTPVQPPDRENKLLTQLKWVGASLFRHAKHVGVGVVCSVAYFDPGNWGVDLQAGSLYGYRLLFVVLLSGLFAVFLQVLASRLGCVTGLDLASHTRLLLYNRTKHPRLFRWLTLYPLYALSEIAIIATDLAELLGSAIALCLLFPKLELWHGVLITVIDVIAILALGDPLRGKPVRMFELLIAVMVLAVLVCMAIIIAKVDVGWGDAFKGYLPSKYVFTSGSLYTSIGIIGATVMPHSLFLGSALATQDRINHKDDEADRLALHKTDSKLSEDTTLSASPLSSGMSLAKIRESVANIFRAPPKSAYATNVTRHSEHVNNTFPFVKAHIYHGIADVVMCLLGFAVLINSFILILASAVFYHGGHDLGNQDPASLFDAYDLIANIVGKPAATLFAIALLASGQSSSFIATVAGQAVSEGFIRWRVSPVIRRLATRLLAIIPSMVVAIAVGRKGIDALLVMSQVTLSIVLPFITFPLLYCTSTKAIMRVRKSADNYNPAHGAGDVEDGDQWVYFDNNKLAIGVGCLIWLVVATANAYVLITLFMDIGA